MAAWLKTRLMSLMRRGRVEEELDRELAFHLDMLTEQNIRAGMPAAEARRVALRDFGKVDGVKEAVRDTWLSRALEALAQDVRYGCRSLCRTPGFVIVVVVTMALGIGANTAIFSVVNGVLLRPLPYADGDQLVVLRQELPHQGVNDRFSFRELEDYRAQSSTLAGIAEFHEMWFILLGRPQPERVSTGVVSTNFFSLLGVEPLLGRDFVAGDERPDAPAVLVLSHRYWQRSFGGDRSIVGRVFQMNDRPHQVIGVLPAVLQYPSDVDVYMPTSACPFRSSAKSIEDRRARMSRAIARVRPGVTTETLSADISGVAERMRAADPALYPEAAAFKAYAIPLQEDLTRSFRRALLVLLGTAGFVLLIVCASVANLTLARLVRREREMSLRSALGASRLRLLRHLLTESTILALAGGIAGLVIAVASLDLLVRFAERFTTRAADVRIDPVVLFYTLGISVATGLVFGSVPAFAGRLSRSWSIGADGRVTHGSRSVRSTLIVAQVAVSFMLLVGAGLTIRTLLELQQVDPGFRTDSIMTMRVDLNFTKYEQPEQRAHFWERLEERLRAMPGVASVGGAGTFPLNEQGPFGNNSIVIEGREHRATDARPVVGVRLASPDYFSTLGQPVLDGRVFTRDDRGDGNPVVIVNQTMAQYFWPGESAIGKRVKGDPDPDSPWLTVVGVVGDARQYLDQTPGVEVYLPMFQSGQLSSNWLLRTDLDAATVTTAVRDAVRSVDAEQPVDHFRALSDVRLSSLESPRLTATLLGLFAALALVITATGLAGVIAFSVNQRTQEFGIRMALGAGRNRVLGLVLREGLQLVLVGLALGTGGALVMTRALTTMLFGVEPTDAVTFLVVAIVLLLVAATACLIPARRAASVDPLFALRVG